LILLLGFVCLTTGLVRSQCASGRLYDRPTRERFVACLVPRANYELVPKINVAQYTSYATLPNVNVRNFASTQPPHRDKNCVIIQSILKPQPSCSSSFPDCMLPTDHFPAGYILHSLTPCLSCSPPSPEGRSGTARERSEQ